MTLSTTANLPHWHDDPEVFDALFLGGQRIPGVVTVKVSRKVKIDKKSPKGKNKAVITKQGVEAAEVDITIRLLSPEDFEEMKALMPLLEPVADKKTTGNDDALDIAHWATWMRNVEAIIIEDTDGPELKDGIFELHIKAVEFERPKTASGSGLAGGVGSGTIYLGIFVDQKGSVIEKSRVAVQGSAAKDASGKLIKGPFGEDIFTWSQLAISDDSAQGYSEQTGTFVGRYFGEDNLLTKAWNDAHVAKPKDATSTPKASKGAANLGDFANPSADPPDPTDTDAGP